MAQVPGWTRFPAAEEWLAKNGPQPAAVAREQFNVETVVARIYDPRRAEIYERLNIPTVATTKWGVKQIQLMLLHDRSELREAIGGGDLLRMRVPVPAHLVGRSPLSLNVDGKLMVVGVSRGGGGFIPTTARCRRATTWP